MDQQDKFLLTEEEFQELIERHGQIMVMETIEDIVKRSQKGGRPCQLPFLSRIEKRLQMGKKTAALNNLA
jgi:hypothetical protein